MDDQGHTKNTRCQLIEKSWLNAVFWKQRKKKIYNS